MRFNPGFDLPALDFTASYLAEPRSFLAETGAEIAQRVAQLWHDQNDV